MKTARWIALILALFVGIPTIAIAQAGKKIDAQDPTTAIEKRTPKIACIDAVGGKQDNTNSEIFWRQDLFARAAEKAGLQLIDPAVVMQAASELGINLKSDFYADTQGPKLLLQLGQKLGADYVCFNALEVKPGKVRRFLYDDAKADGQLRYLVVDVTQKAIYAQGELTSRKEKKNQGGFLVSAFLIGGGGYLVKSKAGPAEKAAISALFDDSYGANLFKAVGQSGKKIGG